MNERHIPGAAWAIMALLLIGVLAVLVAGGVFADHRTPHGESFRQLTQRIYADDHPTPRP